MHDNHNALELEALALEPEEEEASYLTDLNKVPDFVDEPPVEVHEVSSLFLDDYIPY
jgi:charged multivesicular body protein 5